MAFAPPSNFSLANHGDLCVARALAQSDRMLCCAAIVFGGVHGVPASALSRICNGAIAHGPAHRVACAQRADDVASAAVGADREDTRTNFLADWRTSTRVTDTRSPAMRDQRTRTDVRAQELLEPLLYAR